MISLIQLIENIDLPCGIAKKVISLSKELTQIIPSSVIQALTQTETWKQAKSEIASLCPNDPHGLKMLTCMLQSACITYEHYQKRGIEEKVFFDTMKCFTRFVKEYQSYAHTDGFDRSFWCGRQLSMQLFRIQTLEFELIETKEQRVVALHIPSNANLDHSTCLASIQAARVFLMCHFPMYTDASFVCTSWILSPALQELLPNTSRILQFQSLFSIQSWDKEDNSVYQWVFHTMQPSIDHLAEDTYLQRAMKQHLKQGGRIGAGTGILIG